MASRYPDEVSAKLAADAVAARENVSVKVEERYEETGDIVQVGRFPRAEQGLPAPANVAQDFYVDRIGSLFDAIAHGDEKHRAWLKSAIECHFAGEAVSPVVQGNKASTRRDIQAGWTETPDTSVIYPAYFNISARQGALPGMVYLTVRGPATMHAFDDGKEYPRCGETVAMDIPVRAFMETLGWFFADVMGHL